MPTKLEIPYNRSLFTEEDQEAQEQDIIIQLTKEFFDYPTPLVHALHLVYWFIDHFRRKDKDRVPMMSLVKQVWDYLHESKLSEKTSMEQITNEIAPRILEMILRVLKPEFFLQKKQETQV